MSISWIENCVAYFLLGACPLSFTFITRGSSHHVFCYASSVFMEVLLRVPSYETSNEGLTLS
jgi:hypothetical protein